MWSDAPDDKGKDNANTLGKDESKNNTGPELIIWITKTQQEERQQNLKEEK